MIKNYFTIALRNLLKHKLFTGVHIIGLTIAFAIAVVLFLAAMFDLSFDNFHTKKDQLYQVYFETNPVTGRTEDAPMPVPFAPIAKEELKGLANITRYGDGGGVLARHGEKEISITTRFVDPSFLDMFSFPLKQGDKSSVLSDLKNITLTEYAAEKLFGNQDIIGMQVELNIQGVWEPFVVSALLADFPANSTFQFDAFVRFENYPGYLAGMDKWDWRNHTVYVELGDKVSVAQFQQDSKAFVGKYFKSEIDNLKRDGALVNDDGTYKSLKLLPIHEMHFNSMSPGGSNVASFFPWMLLIISAFILFIACTNFINLSLGSSFTRTKEIGMRKTLGARPLQLVVQFWMEASLICLFSSLVGAVLAWAILPQFNALMAYNLQFGELITLRNSLLLLLFFFAVTLAAGAYPGFVMTRFNLMDVLRGTGIRLDSGKNLRKALSVGQFAIAIILVISTLVIMQQINFMNSRSLGYNKSGVVSIPIGNNIDLEVALQRMRVELAALPEVMSVTGTDINMGMGRDGASMTSKMGFDYKERNIKTNWLRVDYDYLKTMEIDLLEGRDFSRAYSTDTTSLLINEQMAALLGEENPVGKNLNISGEDLTVIGVVKDFNFKTLHSKVGPLTMCLQPSDWPVSYIFVRVNSDALQQSMASIEKIWKSVNPTYESTPSFLDENTQRMYEKEKRLSKIIVSGAGFAIFISCLGLFALALLMMNQRVKEIGVRKVLGAKVLAIVLLLSGDFVRLIAIAFIVAAPIAWLIMNRWLDNFAYRIDVSVWLVLAGGIIVLLVAMLIVVLQSLPAAMANPVKSLRTE